MRWQAFIILAAIVLSIAGPPTLILTGVHDSRTEIGTLDVCHSSAPALSSNGEMPCVNECTFNAHPLAPSMVSEISNSPCKPFYIAFQDERPPKS